MNVNAFDVNWPWREQLYAPHHTAETTEKVLKGVPNSGCAYRFRSLFPANVAFGFHGHVSSSLVAVMACMFVPVGS